MSSYTTGELAKLCGVSVRTVQYYDTRGVLTPSALSEGGRRLYSEDDLKTLKTICFLRGIGLTIDNIKELMKDSHSGEVISLLLRQQAQALEKEAEECKQRLETVNHLLAESKGYKRFSVESIQDITLVMERRKNLRSVQMTVLAAGILMDILLLGSILIWIFKANWLPFAVCLPIVILLGVLATKLYYQKTLYLCPECHKLFKPGFWPFLFSAHTIKTRKLSCPHCGRHGFCVETYTAKADS